MAENKIKITGGILCGCRMGDISDARKEHLSRVNVLKTSGADAVTKVSNGNNNWFDSSLLFGFSN